MKLMVELDLAVLSREDWLAALLPVSSVSEVWAMLCLYDL